MRSCYVLAARRLFEQQTADKIWQTQDDRLLIPNLSPSDKGPYSSERLSEFRLAGTFAAIYLLVMRQPVPKLSPHVLLFLLSGSSAPDYGYLKSIHPEAANHRRNMSIDSVASNASALRVGRPGVSDKTLESAAMDCDYGMPLAAISASRQQAMPVTLA
jgi:hypothetical protein